MESSSKPTINLKRHFFELLKPYWRSLLIVGLCAVLGEVIQIATPLIIRSGIVAIEGQKTKLLLTLAVVLLVLSVLGVLFRFGVTSAGHIAGYGAVVTIRSRLYSHLQRLSLQFYQKKKIGDLISRTISDTMTFEQLIAHGSPQLIRCSILIAGSTVVLFLLNWKLAAISLLPIPVMILILMVFSKLIMKQYEALGEKLGHISAMIQENLLGMPVIQAFAREDHELQKFNQKNIGFLNTAKKAMRIIGIWLPLTGFLASAATILTLWFGGNQIIHGQMAIQDLVAFLLYIGFLYGPLMEFAGVLDMIQNARASAKRVFAILEESPIITSSTGAVIPEKFEPRIEFNNVTFAYGTENPVIKNISFMINPGETLALVGSSGAGKSTIASLIARFYDVQSGQILIGKHDIKELDLKFLRESIALILQDVFLFNGTVQENISYGKLNAPMNEIIKAAQAAGADEFIRQLPYGYNTVVGERGTRLSGGEKQRLSIARAFLKDAPILIMDEPTSAVDSETEQTIQKTLEWLMKNRTTLVIAHRLSTIRNADKIIVLENGRAKETGTHQELIQHQGLYKKFWSAQMANPA